MTNYYLDDLRTILSQNNAHLGYTGLDINSIKVDTLIEPETISSQNNFVLLTSQGGEDEIIFTGEGDFAVYVYNSSPTTANDQARALYKYLIKYTGTLGTANSIHFRRITARQKPMRWNSTNSPVHVFMFTMTAQINDSDNSIPT
jgi:hypothetical protein